MRAAVIILFVTVTIAQSNPVVVTPYGTVAGLMDLGVQAFRGIPFAKPPVGALRFHKTEPLVPWVGVLNATSFAPGCIASCPNTSFPIAGLMCTPTVSEDCLYLNIFAPVPAGGNLLPVLIFIHGGNYVGGSGGVPLYDGADLAKNQNIVVVTINYRLGILGALYTGTVKGNFQTMDQRESFRFVRNIIASFGGDPDKITISGQSAGAFSVATHVSSPKSWGLFERAAIISNPFALLAATPEMAIQLGEKVLAALNCTAGGDEELVCLRSVTADQILTAQNKPIEYSDINLILAFMMEWVPVVDGDELPYQPLFAMTHGQIVPKVPIYFGTVANESVEFIYDISPGPLPEWAYYILMDVIFGPEIAAQLNAFYGPPPASMKDDVREFVTVIATDYIFYCPNRFVGAALTTITDTFMYYFDELASYSAYVYNASMPWCVHNVCHADDLSFYFNPFKAPLPPDVHPPTPTPAEFTLAHFMQTALANFVRSGNPNPLSEGIIFPRFNGTQNVLVNYSTPSSLLPGYRNKECDFWDKIGYNRF